jgi:hypothetical protein
LRMTVKGGAYRVMLQGLKDKEYKDASKLNQWGGSFWDRRIQGRRFTQVTIYNSNIFDTDSNHFTCVWAGAERINIECDTVKSWGKGQDIFEWKLGTGPWWAVNIGTITHVHTRKALT